MTENIALMEFESNPNIGLYIFVNDKFCIIGKNLENKKKEIEKILKVPIYVTSIFATDLLGVFISGNNEYLLIPKMYDYELNIFKEIEKEHKIKLIISNEILNTFGNNITFGNEQILISAKYPKKFKDKLEKETNLKIIPLKNKNYDAIGSVCAFVNGKFFISQDLEENEISDFLKFIGGIGTVNSGSNFVSSGIIGNKYGILIGSNCSTIEIQNILESLNYL